METEGRVLGVLNVNVLDEREPFARPTAPMTSVTLPSLRGTSSARC
jgi:hypothetical protein